MRFNGLTNERVFLMENILETKKVNIWKSGKFWKNHMGILIGAFLYTAPYNLITTPMGLYSGYLTGAAQIIRTLLSEGLHIPMTFDWTGIILYMMNIPLLFLAYKALGKRFFAETVFTVTLTAIFFSVIPAPSAPLIEDKLTACLIAGVISGFGAGLILRCGSSGGGVDIIGMYFLKKNPNFGVGKISMMVAAFIFLYCGVFYELEIVIYSVIFTAAGTMAMDRAHYQNVKMSVLIITKSAYIGDLITCSLERSATYWEGTGAYSLEPYYVYVAAISKYEAGRLKAAIEKVDPSAFVIFQNIQSVAGHFESHL